MTLFCLNMLERKILLIISIREGIKQTFYKATLIWEIIKITNLGNPGSANDAVSKRFLYERIHKLTTDYNLESVSGNINSFKNEIAVLQQSLLSNRESIQEKSMSLQNEMQTEETTSNEVNTNTAERIRIAESISSVKRDLHIISEQLASNNVGRSLAAKLRAAKKEVKSCE